MTSYNLEEELSKYVGKSAGEPFVALDEVNLPMIRHWCEAMGDRNPIYSDPKVARSYGHPGVVAPPAMLQAWGMRGLGFEDPDKSSLRTTFDELMDLLNENGYSSVVATNCDQSYGRYLRLGDRVVAHPTIESISNLKTTGLGTGYFVTTTTQYKTPEGEQIGFMKFRILKFSPKTTFNHGSNSTS